ncbi:MAG TPA: hypothetical protein VFB38_12265 [Chthonomonadaceae bacterium]|nr:hypothetical protein [Chthonomonadaceae bacterium]
MISKHGGRLPIPVGNAIGAHARRRSKEGILHGVAGEGGQIAGCGVVIGMVEAVRIDEMGIECPHLPRGGIHLGDESLRRAGNMLGSSYAGIVGADEQDGVQQVAGGKRLAVPHTQRIAGRRGGSGRDGDVLLGRNVAGQEQCRQDLGRAGWRQALIGLLGEKHRAGLRLYDDGRSGANGRRLGSAGRRVGRRALRHRRAQARQQPCPNYAYP